MTNDHENISDIRRIISKVNYKLDKMKDHSGDILSKDDTDDFFKHFLDLCTNKDTLDKTNVQQTFFDKIKNWYKKFLGENRNINLDEFKFINEEAKILTESVCNKEDYETIKNIFLLLVCFASEKLFCICVKSGFTLETIERGGIGVDAEEDTIALKASLTSSSVQP